VGEDMGMYNPLESATGTRLQSSLNKQASSEEKSTEISPEIAHIMLQLSEHQAATFRLYQELVKARVAKEIARFWLPQSQYQIMFIQFDLSNLIKMLTLRDDTHAQLETQIYAQAISTLCEPLFPVIFKAYRNSKAGLALTGNEVEAFKANTKLNTKSKSEQAAFEQKSKRLKM
jgi:thymidylate synthase ThyX